VSETLAGSTTLCTLNIDGCISLHGLLLPDHLQLTRLQAGGCKRLRTITCASPALEVCLAQSCLHLEVGGPHMLACFQSVPHSAQVPGMLSQTQNEKCSTSVSEECKEWSLVSCIGAIHA
jgi:hypothetical protein